MKIYTQEDFPQLSPEWWGLRAGVPTSSDAKRIITAKTGAPSAGQAGYAAELCADMVCASPKYFSNKGRPINRHTDYGRDMEEEARRWFSQSEYCEGFDVCQVGFVTTDDGRFGASPDLMAGKGGRWAFGGEIKNVEPHKHAKLLVKGALPLEFKAQVHHCLAVTGLPYWYWISYSDLMDKLVIKVEPDEFTEALKVQLEAFWVLLQETKQKLGVTRGVDVTEEDKVEAWKLKLEQMPDEALLNSWLPELTEITNKATKRACWNLITEYARQKVWVFDGEIRGFKLEELPSDF